ncbi:MAG: Na+/H+ antiporter NhaA [Actinobacteria bacterium]|nr:Na+/H+ antiporter NhaA [Actinomycetota bacterium]
MRAVGIPRRGPVAACQTRSVTRPARSRWRGLSPLREFLQTEAAGGALLVVAAVAALVWANSPWQHGYESLWQTRVSFGVAGHHLALDLRHWVNDGLMAVFFLVVGLEIKREVSAGHLAGRRAATLPVAAALGGMLVPALVYLAIAGRTAAHGWGVPMATDIALAVGVLALVGDRVPTSLRAFLLGLAVVDDIGAIVVIAVFYSTGVTFGWLAAGATAVLATLLVRRTGVQNMLVFLVIGGFLWFSLHEAGVHPTLSGVIMGLLAPMTPRRDRQGVPGVSTVVWLEHLIHPWTSFLIVPMFALANAGIEVSTHSLRVAWSSPIAWGVLLGLLAGKPVGVLLATWAAARSGVADRPPGANARHLLGAGNAAGIGFTVALFIAELAFRTDKTVNIEAVADAKLAILVASLISGVIAFVVLRRSGQVAASAANTADQIAVSPTDSE